MFKKKIMTALISVSLVATMVPAMAFAAEEPAAAESATSDYVQAESDTDVDTIKKVMEEELEGVREDLETLNKVASANQSQIDMLTNAIDNIDWSLLYNNDWVSAKSEVERLSAKLAEVKAGIADQVAEALKNIDMSSFATAEEMTAVSKDLESLQGVYDSLNDSVVTSEAFETAMQNVNTAMETAKSEAIEAAKAYTDQEIAKLQTQITEVRSAVETLKEDADGTTEDVNDLSSKISEAEAVIASLEEKLASLSGEGTETNFDVSTAENIQAALTEISTKLNTLNSETVTVLNNSIKELKEQQEKNRAEIEALKTELAKIRMERIEITTKATASNYNTVVASWTRNGSSSVSVKYDVYMAVGAESFTKVKEGITATSYKVTSAKTGTAYKFYIVPTAEFSGLTLSGDKSNTATVTPSLAKAATPTVKSTVKKKATVKYSKVAGANGYQIGYRIGTGTEKYKTTTSTSYTITALTSGKTYKFRVRAYRTVDGKKVYGAWSSAKSAKVK